MAVIIRIGADIEQGHRDRARAVVALLDAAAAYGVAATCSVVIDDGTPVDLTPPDPRPDPDRGIPVEAIAAAVAAVDERIQIKLSEDVMSAAIFAALRTPGWRYPATRERLGGHNPIPRPAIDAAQASLGSDGHNVTAQSARDAVAAALYADGWD